MILIKLSTVKGSIPEYTWLIAGFTLTMAREPARSRAANCTTSPPPEKCG